MPVSPFKNHFTRNLPAILAIVGGYSFYLLPQFLNFGGQKGFCLFRAVTGIPCPGCGMGKATLLLSRGEFIEATFMHPLVIPFSLAVAVAIIWLIIDLILKRETLLPILKQGLKWPYLLVLITIIVLSWIWNITNSLQ